MNKNFTFKFTRKNNLRPKRIVILGTSGIISTNLQKILKKKSIKVISIGRSKLNFKNKNSTKILTKKIKSEDVIIFCSAEAPAKNIIMLINNLKICNTICNSLKNKKISQIIYISSDAVYADSRNKITENSSTAPNNFHGIMHLTRELILKNQFNKLLCILRPTMIYGDGNTHNGYGPNQFLNFALKNEPLSIFGNGEERRDHMYIEDLVKIIVKCIERRGVGSLNLVSGKVYTFKYLAELIINISKSKSKLIKVKRLGSMPHNGYRPFNIRMLKHFFGDIRMTSIKEGLRNYTNILRK